LRSERLAHKQKRAPLPRDDSYDGLPFPLSFRKDIAEKESVDSEGKEERRRREKERRRRGDRTTDDIAAVRGEARLKVGLGAAKPRELRVDGEEFGDVEGDKARTPRDGKHAATIRMNLQPNDRLIPKLVEKLEKTKALA